MPKRSASVATPDLELPVPTWILPRSTRFLLLLALSVAWAWQPLTTVIGRSLQSAEYEHYSYIILLPFMSAYLIYQNRGTIFRHTYPGLRLGILLAAPGVATIWLARTTLITGNPEHRLSLAMLGLVMLWAGGFVLCYGFHALRAAAFPFLLLLFMIPLPPAVLTAIIVFLQKASAEASALLFSLTGMPVFRRGLYFELPGLTIHVAQECSGIRSSLALLISGLMMSYVLLRSTWTRATLVLLIVPLAIVKNAVRIVGLSWLAVYVDRSFITGGLLHRMGGIPLFVTSLVILAGIAWLLRKYDLPAAKER